MIAIGKHRSKLNAALPNTWYDPPGNSKVEYDKVGDEIYRLREEKQKVQLDNVGRDELKKRITDMSDFLRKRPTAITEYDEPLVRRLIEKVTVYEDKFTVEFESGVTVDVDK